MNRFGKAAATLLLTLVTIAPGFAADRVFNLLVIDAQKGEPYQSVREAMLGELERIGYRQGRNLVIKHYSIGNQDGAVRSIVDAEKTTAYDAVFGNGTMAVTGLKNTVFGDARFKIVFAAVTDPVGIGAIDRFDAPPKANFTGVSYPVPVIDRLRFIRQTMPSARRIGLVDTDMPQSVSYRKWLTDALALPEFRDYRLITRTVSFVRSEEGHRRMAELAKKQVQEIDGQVDVFLACNDQMCVQQPFAEIVHRVATKPLVAVGKREVLDGWGATMSIYPDQEAAGRMAAGMIHQVFKGTPISAIHPRTPPAGLAFDLNKTAKFGIRVPQKLIDQAGKDATHVIYVPKDDDRSLPK